MKKYFVPFTFFIFSMLPASLWSQIDEGKTGAWYMYFWNTTLTESAWGFQGDIQYRNWNIMGDLEQLLLRGGLTYQPRETPVKFTLGYAYVLTGEFGNGNDTSNESRIYQEALLSQQIGARFYLNHRFRYEQRFVENQDFRTRWRYNLFITVPLNQTDLGPGAFYIAFYNELFINGQRDIGDGNTVALFDRNRTYGALGYSIAKGLRLQLGFMQQTTEAWKKGQIQLSAHHTF